MLGSELLGCLKFVPIKRNSNEESYSKWNSTCVAGFW